MNTEEKHISVSELNRRAKFALDESFGGNVWVEGEVRQIKPHSSGNLYFSMRDENAQVDCSMWRNVANLVAFRLEEGMKVAAYGQVTLYEKTGRYQFVVYRMLPAGLGARAIEFALLKQKLDAEGLFEVSRKRKLPSFPKSIGVVTSKTGAALRDIVNIISRRAPWVTIICRNALVQGEAAPPDIISGIRELNDLGEVDLIIVGRGGGSEEDLWCFNDERLARAIAFSQIPIISAVGHEVDFTIADFVADLRAPTPSAAAEIAVPDMQDFTDRIHIFVNSIFEKANSRLLKDRNKFDRVAHRLEMQSPLVEIAEYRRMIDEFIVDADRAIAIRIERRRTRLQNLHELLSLLSVDNVLARGFAIVRKNGKIIKAASKLSHNDFVEITFARGRVQAEVVKDSD